jgi:transposase
MIIQFKNIYVGIDIHKTQHIAAILKIPMNNLSSENSVNIMRIENNIGDFQSLDEEIKNNITQDTIVKIAVDYTGGHYSEPLVYYLVKKGYSVCYVEPKGMKAVRDKMLDKDSKTDLVDAESMAKLL